MSSAADKAAHAEKHLGMLFGKAETLRTESWRAIHNVAQQVGEKRMVLEKLAEARDLWARIYDAAAQMLPETEKARVVTKIAGETVAHDEEPEVDW